MEPIISPWLFYWIGIADGLLILLSVLLAGSVIALLVTTIFYACDKEKLMPHFWKYLVGVFALGLMLVLVPTKDTLYKMIIAQNITYERVSKAGDIGKELHKTLKQDVLDIIKELTRGKEKK
jgi:hypothetical protein